MGGDDAPEMAVFEAAGPVELDTAPASVGGVSAEETERLVREAEQRSVGGERLVVCYGMPGDAIEFQGIATTPNPAENMARITNVLAENDGRTLRIAAERVDEAALPGRTVFYKGTGRTGRVEKVLTQGRYYGLRATAENPVLKVHVGRDVVFTELKAACMA